MVAAVASAEKGKQIRPRFPRVHTFCSLSSPISRSSSSRAAHLVLSSPMRFVVAAAYPLPPCRLSPAFFLSRFLIVRSLSGLRACALSRAKRVHDLLSSLLRASSLFLRIYPSFSLSLSSSSFIPCAAAPFVSPIVSISPALRTSAPGRALPPCRVHPLSRPHTISSPSFLAALLSFLPARTRVNTCARERWARKSTDDICRT